MADNGFAWGLSVRAALDDESQVDPILQKLNRRIRSAAARYVPRDIDEGIQAASIAVWKALPQTNLGLADCEIEQYLVTTAINAIRSAGRQARRRSRREHAFTDDDELHTRATTLENNANNRSARHTLTGIELRMAAETMIQSNDEGANPNGKGKLAHLPWNMIQQLIIWSDACPQVCIAAGLSSETVRQLVIWSDDYAAFSRGLASAIISRIECA